MSRRQWYLDRIEETYQESLAAEVAVGLLEARLGLDPSFLTKQGIGNRGATELRNNLEDTYLIRLFAVFEGGVRDAWGKKWKRDTDPPAKDLINSVGGKQPVPHTLVQRVHVVREYRNSLIHAAQMQSNSVKIRDCHRSLCEYFHWLPKDW
jgi:hypothetical protein